MQYSMKIAAGLAVAGLVLAGCEGENWFANTDVALADTPDSFRAVEFVFENELGDVRDLIAEGDGFELVLDDDRGEFESTFRLDGRTIRRDGTFTISGNEIVFSDDPFSDDDLVVERSIELVRADNVILLTDPNAVFDVDGDGDTEIAEMYIRLDRR